MSTPAMVRPTCPSDHPVVPARLSVCKGMWWCGKCGFYYAGRNVTPAQPDVAYAGRPSEQP